IRNHSVFSWRSPSGPVRTWFTATLKEAIWVPFCEKRTSGSPPRLPSKVTRNISLSSLYFRTLYAGLAPRADAVRTEHRTLVRGMQQLFYNSVRPHVVRLPAGPRDSAHRALL